MANPFDVQVFNPLQALMLGQQSYASGIESNKKREQEAARNEAGQLYAAGDVKGALNRLLMGGDLQGAGTYSGLDQNSWTRQHTEAQDAERKRQFELTHRLAQQRLSEREPNELERRAKAGGLVPGTPPYQEFMLRGGRNSDVTPSVTEKKEIFKSEDELPNIQGTIEALNRAKDLNQKTFTGYTAGTRAEIGSRVPGGGYLVDKGAADATTEWQNIMSQEAITTMADSLKGATTDFELNTFKKDLADPTTPPQIRERIINRMLKLAERQKAIKERRIKELPGGSYFKPGGGAPSTTGPTGQTTQIPPAAIEALRANPALKDEFEAKYGKGTAGVVMR